MVLLEAILSPSGAYLHRLAGPSDPSFSAFNKPPMTGLINLLVTPEYYGFAVYLGLLMLANLAGSVVSAVGIYQGKEWGWWLGVVVAGGAFLAYIVSRTLGLPGLPSWEPFMEPPGLISLVVEAIFVGVAARVLSRGRRSTASSGEAS
jgi:hypothetical protein